MSTSTFPELLREEQHVALVSVIVERMSELEMLNEVVAARPTEDVARQIVDVSDASETERVATGKAMRSLISKTTGAMSRAASEKAVPAVKAAGSKVAGAIKKSEPAEVDGGKTPLCPECGSPTVTRVNSKTGKPFMACSAWIDTGCGWTAKIEIAS
jgi:hypothetical protein